MVLCVFQANEGYEEKDLRRIEGRSGLQYYDICINTEQLDFGANREKLIETSLKSIRSSSLESR